MRIPEPVVITTVPVVVEDDFEKRRALAEAWIAGLIEAEDGLEEMERRRRNLRVYITLIRRQAFNLRQSARTQMVRRTPERRCRVAPSSQRSGGRRSTGSSVGGGDPGGGDPPGPPSWRDAAQTFLVAVASTVLAHSVAGGAR